MSCSVPEVLCITAVGSKKLPTSVGPKQRHFQEKWVCASVFPILCSPEQSNDDLVMEVLSDIMMQLPLAVENEDVSGPESQSTFKFIMASPIWERLNKNIQGE